MFDMQSFLYRVIHGLDGYLSYLRHEVVTDTHDTLAAFLVRTLANPRLQESEAALRQIIQQRTDNHIPTEHDGFFEMFRVELNGYPKGAELPDWYEGNFDSFAWMKGDDGKWAMLETTASLYDDIGEMQNCAIEDCLIMTMQPLASELVGDFDSALKQYFTYRGQGTPYMAQSFHVFRETFFNRFRDEIEADNFQLEEFVSAHLFVARLRWSHKKSQSLDPKLHIQGVYPLDMRMLFYATR